MRARFVCLYLLLYAFPAPFAYLGAHLVVKLRRVEASTLRLPSRGFHWIQESPFNR